MSPRRRSAKDAAIEGALAGLQAAFGPPQRRSPQGAQAPLGLVIERPPGVYWARMGEKAGSGMCGDATHSVYERLIHRRKRGAPAEQVAVRVYACAVCWPDENQTGAKGAVA